MTEGPITMKCQATSAINTYQPNDESLPKLYFRLCHKSNYCVSMEFQPYEPSLCCGIPIKYYYY